MRVKKIVVWALAGAVVVGVGSHWAFAWRARKSPKWVYAERALARSVPDYDLRNCVDLEMKERRDFREGKWKPMPCINTATSNYNKDFRAGNCAKFVQNPGKWGFREVGASEAVPGDLIIFFMKNGYARHAAVYIQDSLLGPLCATTAYPKGGYYRYCPYRLVVGVTRWLGSFRAVRYYRYGD